MANPFNNQEIHKNIKVGGNLSCGDITVINNGLQQTYEVPLVGFQNSIPSLENFVGREELIKEVIQAFSSHRLIAILGISGIGKSAIMAKIASYLNLQQVFWYEFQAELAFLDDVLLKLAHYSG